MPRIAHLLFRYADALLLAGVDYLVVGPKVLEELNSQFTMSGYNDGKPSFPPQAFHHV